MQTTLLGLAFTMIAALIAALVGPLFIDWNQFRPRFEAEAARVIGAHVRVDGALDARLLPTPTLRLRKVSVGDPGRLSAERFDIEFSLGSLMRGEWRASEFSVAGLAVDLGFDPHGRLDLPAGLSDFSALSVDRLTLTGRLAVRDAVRKSILALDDIVFAGEVRAQTGTIRGDGNFSLDGVRHPFRISTSAAPDAKGVRARLTVESIEDMASADLDGLISLEGKVPRFDGSATLASGAYSRMRGAADDPLRRSMRAVAKVKADPLAARLDQIDLTFGAEAKAFKFGGSGEATFATRPSLALSLSARQLDADRLIAGDAADQPLPVVALRDALLSLTPPPIATQLAVTTDQVTLGGRAIQNVAIEAKSDAAGWRIDRLDLRAPGGTQTRISDATIESGRLDGLLAVESADPQILAAWLTQRSDAPLRLQRPLRAQGRLTATADAVAIEGLSLDTESAALSGRVSYTGGPRQKPKIEAAIRADRLDFEQAREAFASFGWSQDTLPADLTLSLDIGRADIGGNVLQPFAAQIGASAARLSLDRLSAGPSNGLRLDGSGFLDRGTTTGKLDLTAQADSFSRLTAILAQISPSWAARLDAFQTPGPARLALSLDVSPSGAADRTEMRGKADIDASALEATLRVTATPPKAAVRDADITAWLDGDLRADANLTAKRGIELFRALGLDRTIAASNKPASFEASAAGRIDAPLRLKAHLEGDALSADLEGTAEPFATEPKAALNMAIARAKLAPSLGIDTTAATIAGLTTRLSITGGKIGLDGIDGTIGGSRLRGWLGIARGDETVVDGQMGLDAIDLGSVFRLVMGGAGSDAEPVALAALRGWRGRIAFQAPRGALPGGIGLTAVSGALRSDGTSFGVEGLRAGLGGGQASADITARRSADGVALDAKVSLAGVDGGALRLGALAMPAGRIGLQASLVSSGRSLSALAGSLAGAGTVKLDKVRIAGLDAGVFEAARRANDSGQPLNDDRLLQIVEPVLARGGLAVAAAQIPFGIGDGRIRVSATPIEGEGARAIVSGGYDIMADQADIQADLTPDAAPGDGVRPQLRIFSAGPPDRMSRSVDVAGLSLWLAARRIDRESVRLQALERETNLAPLAPSPAPVPAPAIIPAIPDGGSTAAPAAVIPVPGRDPRRIVVPQRSNVLRPPPATARGPSADQAPPLPPPVEVRPVPGDPRLRARGAPLVLTPQPANPARGAF